VTVFHSALGLPLNIHGLPPTDPLAQMPLIDFGPLAMPVQQPIWPSQLVVPDTPGCTVICIGPQNPSQQQPPPPPNIGPPGPSPPG
jgi:hypothetical protein